jgi:glyoxylase-like metal-dependent hydrolase (beta-lactamase superfamily II)
MQHERVQRERVADDVYVFTSDRYAQVTASIVLTEAGAVLIDTLVFPEETREIKRFVETRLHSRVRTIIYTHYHADHTYGACLFPDAQVIAHARCFDLLDTRGREGLEQARQNNKEFAEVSIVLPTLVFKETLSELMIGEKTFDLWHTPGNSPDAIVCLLKEDRILFAGDTLMPVPYFVDGDYATYVKTLESLRGCNFENIIQGHGEIILKGEIEEKLADDLAYLTAIKRFVDLAAAQPDPQKYLRGIDIEQCGKSRVALGGTVNDLHHVNLNVLYKQLHSATPVQ